MMNNDRKLVTIITEAVLEAALCDFLADLGASGYTVTNARGSGSRGVRSAGWSASSNVRIEVVCSEEMASVIAKQVSERYYADYAMILFESDIHVLRPDKFS
jgi:nitrogen regulatory protein PII